MNETLTLDKNASSRSRPFIAKRSWLLTQDNAAASDKEAFFAVQVELTDTTAGIVCLESGHTNSPVNPIIVPFSGAIIPVEGIGYLSTGDDAYGNTFTTSANVGRVIALGGDQVQ